MKHTIALATAILLLATTATVHADIWTKKTPEPPTAIEYSAATHKLVAGYIEAQGWCQRIYPTAPRAAAPAPKSGQIVIYYTRDKSGRCVSAFKAGR